VTATTTPHGVAIELAGLVVTAGGATILGPLDLTVEAGEHLLLVGASGSGKSTLLRAVAGLAIPSAGVVALDGHEVSRPGKLVVRPEERGVGMLFQGGALWPHLSVRRTLGFVLARAGVKGAEATARITELLADVELSGFDDRMPATLSGGEKQRLALARALATGAGGPRILLLDEPLGPLDVELRAALLAKLAALHAKHRWTVIHVTHDPAEARDASTRVARLVGGRLVSIEDRGAS
jgi:iron(III) transport system ATP-binding protein